MFYKKFAAVVLSAVLVGAVPCSVLGASDVSSVTDGVVEELSMEDDFSDGADSISALASALADKTVSEVQDYQEAKAEAEVIAQERLEAATAGYVVYYGMGMVYFYLITHLVTLQPIGWKAIVLVYCLPEMPADYILCILAAIMARRLRPMVQAYL